MDETRMSSSWTRNPKFTNFSPIKSDIRIKQLNINHNPVTYVFFLQILKVKVEIYFLLFRACKHLRRLQMYYTMYTVQYVKYVQYLYCLTWWWSLKSGLSIVKSSPLNHFSKLLNKS